MSDLSHDVAPWFTDVNYKDANVMLSVLKKLRDATATFPNHRDVFVQPSLHGGRFTYRGTKPHDWITRIECLGHLNWLAERFAMLMNDGRKFYSCIGFATFDAAAKDVLSHNAFRATSGRSSRAGSPASPRGRLSRCLVCRGRSRPWRCRPSSLTFSTSTTSAAARCATASRTSPPSASCAAISCAQSRRAARSTTWASASATP